MFHIEKNMKPPEAASQEPASIPADQGDRKDPRGAG